MAALPFNSKETPSHSMVKVSKRAVPMPAAKPHQRQGGTGGRSVIEVVGSIGIVRCNSEAESAASARIVSQRGGAMQRRAWSVAPRHRAVAPAQRLRRSPAKPRRGVTGPPYGTRIDEGITKRSDAATPRKG